MPNWCSTSIDILNPKSESIRKLEIEFNNAFKFDEIPNGFGEKWLGNILGYLGYDEKTILHGNIECRGEVAWMEAHGNVLHIETETAWIPMFKPFLKMIEKYAPDSEITYYATEEGCGIHSTNDESMVGTIYVDVWDALPDELDWLEEMNDTNMKKPEFLREIAESMGWDIPENEIEKKVEDEFSELFSYSEWEYAEPSEW